MAAVGANGGGSVIIGHDPQDVGLRRPGGCGVRTNQSNEQKAEEGADGVWLGHDEVREARRAMNAERELGAISEVKLDAETRADNRCRCLNS